MEYKDIHQYLEYKGGREPLNMAIRKSKSNDDESVESFLKRFAGSAEIKLADAIDSVAESILEDASDSDLEEPDNENKSSSEHKSSMVDIMERIEKLKAKRM